MHIYKNDKSLTYGFCLLQVGLFCIVAVHLSLIHIFIAEELSDDARLRGLLRGLMMHSGILVSRAAGKEDSVYAPYYDFKEAVSKIAGHRVLAIDRGEREKFLKVSIELEDVYKRQRSV